MTIKKFKCFSIECELCCEIHFNEDDTFVSAETEDNFKLVPYQEFLDMKLKDVIKMGGEDTGNWYSLLYKMWVVCPECGAYLPVWYDRLYHILSQPTDEWLDTPLRKLIEENKVTLVKHMDYDDFGVKCVYGNEEEILI